MGDVIDITSILLAQQIAEDAETMSLEDFEAKYGLNKTDEPNAG